MSNTHSTTAELDAQLNAQILKGDIPEEHSTLSMPMMS